MKTLKATLLILFALVLFVPGAQAQHARMGIKGGLNASNLYLDNVDDQNARFGLNLGFYGQILSTDAFAIQPELLFSTKGAKWMYTGVVKQDVTLNLNYLDVPVLAVIKLGKTAELHAGPYAGYLLSANAMYAGDLANGTDEIDRDDLNTGDFGLAGGLGLNFGDVQIGARYNYGLTELAKSSRAKNILGDSKNSTAQLYIAFNLAK